MDKLRICFAGTPAFAAVHLEALLASRHTVIAVYTQPDRPAGRGKKLQPSAVKSRAQAHGIPVLQPVTLKNEAAQQQLRELSPDVLVVVAYGLILPQPILDIPRFGCINVHASLLPRWRGAAPIERALLAGDEVTGVTIMQMDAGLDTGAMLATESVPIAASDSRIVLEDKLSRIGPPALVRVLDDLVGMQKNAVKQDDSRSTYAAKVEKAEALIRWDQPAVTIDRQVRAGIGRNPAYSFLDGERLRILEASPLDFTHAAPPGTIVASDKDWFCVACQRSQLQVRRVQLPGKSDMRVSEVVNSRPDLFRAGKLFTDGGATES